MISLDRILESHKKISPYINHTPLVTSDLLSQNRTVKLKLESHKQEFKSTLVYEYTTERGCAARVPDWSRLVYSDTM